MFIGWKDGERSTFDPNPMKLPVTGEIPATEGSDLHEVDINGKVLPHHTGLHLGVGARRKEKECVYDHGEKTQTR